MTLGEGMIEKAKEIRQRLRNPPNAVYDPGINLTRKSTAYKGDIPPPGTPSKKKLNEPKPQPIHPIIVFPITFDDVVHAVSTHYGISVESIKGPKRYKPLVHARQVVVHLALKLLANRSLCSIGRELEKDHTSILHAKNKIRGYLSESSVLTNEINMIEATIVANHSY